MGLFNKDTKNEQQTTYQKCEDLIKLSTVPSTEVKQILEQVYAVINELEAIDQNIDELEVVTEVLEQNGYEFLNSQQTRLIEKTLKINKGGRELVLTNEAINKLNLDIKLGGLILDLRNFEFAGGDLVLNVKASFSGLEVYVNNDVAIHDWIENKYSGVSYNYNNVDYDSSSKLPKFDLKHTITLEGKIKGSGITFRVDHDGSYVNEMHHQGHAFQHRTKAQLDDKLEQELNKIESRADKKRTRIKNKIERKKEKLNINE